jgi:hypothetical protein
MVMSANHSYALKLSQFLESTANKLQSTVEKSAVLDSVLKYKEYARIHSKQNFPFLFVISPISQVKSPQNPLISWLCSFRNKDDLKIRTIIANDAVNIVSARSIIDRLSSFIETRQTNT